jgi:predicted nucleic acid-binding protein
VVAPTLLLVEVASAVGRRTGNAAVAERLVQRLRVLPAVRWVSLTPRAGNLAAAAAITYRLRGADAVYAALAEHLRIPLVTWDNDQLTRTRPPVVARTP